MQASAVWLETDFGMFSDSLPVQVLAIVAPTLLRCLSVSQMRSFLSHGSACSSVELQCEEKGSGVFTWLGLGHTPGHLWKTSQQPSEFHYTLSILPQEQARAHALLLNGAQSSNSPSVSLNSLPASQEGSSFLYWTPGLGCPICLSNCSLPSKDLCSCNLPLSLSSIREAQVPT